MKAFGQWLSDWRHGLIAFGFAALALLAAIFVPDSRWEKLGHAIGVIAANPAGALAIVSIVAGAVTTLRGAWTRVPPSLLVLALLGASGLVGCGAQLSDSQRAALAVRTQQCLIAERAIVDDPCGSLDPDACEARDTAALAASRAQCDADRAAIVGGGQ